MGYITPFLPTLAKSFCRNDLLLDTLQIKFKASIDLNTDKEGSAWN